MIGDLLKLLLFNVVLARPTKSSSSQEHETTEETEDDSGPSSTEEDKNDEAALSNKKCKDIDYIETASCHTEYSSFSPSLEISKENGHMTVFSGPRPPDSMTHQQYVPNQHECVVAPIRQLSALSLDRSPSMTTMYMESPKLPLSRELTPDRSYSTLSADDLTLDARACARPRRRNNDTKTKATDEAKLYENIMHKDKEGRSHRGESANDRDSIEYFIKQLVSSQQTTKPNVLFFDAAIVYEKEDYHEAMSFKEETMMIVKSEYDEEIRIELFDSAVFAQSKVCVVQDVIDKCSMVFVYLTNNFRSPELKFFVEEAIGICRLELGNTDIQSGFFQHDRQWIVKPVHTASPKMRAYKVPSGLLTVSGIDWYDKHTAHTQHQIRAVIRTAYNARKLKERETYISGLPPSQINLINQDPVSQVCTAPTRPASTNVLRNVADMGNKMREHINSNTSVDALSLSDSMSQSSYMQNQQISYSQNENIPGRMYHTPRADSNGLPQNVAGDRYISDPYSPMYPSVDANRSIEVNILPYTQLQTGQGPYMGSQVDQYLQPPGYPYTDSQQGYIAQSAGIQGHNANLPPLNGNVSNLSNAQINPGYDHHPYVGMSQVGYNGQVQYGHPSQGQYNFMTMSSNPEVYGANRQFYQRTNSGLHTQGNNSNSQLPLQQQNMNFDQQIRYHQHQAVNREVYPREPGNFLRDQRNDAPPNSELSVVSKVTGSLIVNPNLSTEDVEVDYGNPTPSRHTKSRPSNSRAKHKRRTKYYESTDSEESSSDSECEKTKLGPEKRRKAKIVNVIGGKIVQIGRKNKVVESGRDRSHHSEKSIILQTKDEHIGIKSGTDSFGNCPSRDPDYKNSAMNQVKADTNSTSERNVLSTDNMSMESSMNSMNFNKKVKEKVMHEKMTDAAMYNDDQKLEDSRIEVLDKNEHDIDKVNISQMNIASNDRYSRCYSQKFRSVIHHGSNVEGNSGGALNENDDNLFESGPYDPNISTENNVTMACFTFSKAKEDRLKESSSFIKSMSRDMYYVNDNDDID